MGRIGHSPHGRCLLVDVYFTLSRASLFLFLLSIYHSAPFSPYPHPCLFLSAVHQGRASSCVSTMCFCRGIIVVFSSLFSLMLCVSLSFCQSACLPDYLSICLLIYLPVFCKNTTSASSTNTFNWLEMFGRQEARREFTVRRLNSNPLLCALSSTRRSACEQTLQGLASLVFFFCSVCTHTRATFIHHRKSGRRVSLRRTDAPSRPTSTLTAAAAVALAVTTRVAGGPLVSSRNHQSINQSSG